VQSSYISSGSVKICSGDYCEDDVESGCTVGHVGRGDLCQN